MVDRQLRARDIDAPRVLEAMERVPRHRFIAAAFADQAYEDHPLPIGRDQTISQPYIVALTTQLARPCATHRALDVGTGSGYQAAVLAELVQQVYSVEVLPRLAQEAKARLAALGYDNITLRCADGAHGWSEHAPFDVIVVAAAPAEVPAALLEQLAPGGRLVIPIGSRHQTLTLFEKRADGSLQRRDAAAVRFVPMTS